MTLYKDIVATSEPSTLEEVKRYFKGDNRTEGKVLKSFDVTLNLMNTNMDLYTSHFNVYASHYDLTAVFE